MSFEVLKKKIEEYCIDEAILIVEGIGCRRDVQAVPLLIDILQNTDSHILRNAVALALSDINSQEAVEPIINLLQDPKTFGYRGTLLYALEPLDYSAHIEMLVKFLYERNFEVSRQSLFLIELISKRIPKGMLEQGISMVRSKIEELEDKIEFLSEAEDTLLNLRRKD